MTQQRQQAVADQVCGGFLPARHRDDRVGDDFLLAQPVAVDFGGHQRVQNALPRLVLVF